MSQSNDSSNPPTKSKAHKIQIRNRKGAEDRISSGANMEVILDGHRLGGASFVKFEVSAKKVAKVLIELYAEVEVEANILLGEPELLKVTGLSQNGKPVARYAISSYAPVGMDTKIPSSEE